MIAPVHKTQCAACKRHPRQGKKELCKACYARKVAGCAVQRRYLTRTETLHLDTGKLTSDGPARWETGACGTPLFALAEIAAGKCRSCAKGWTHPHNYPTETGVCGCGRQKYSGACGRCARAQAATAVQS